MNDVRKTIGWADKSWNPIKGLCPVGCWYCYAKKYYHRFGIEKYKKDLAELRYCRGLGKFGDLFFDKQELPAPSFTREPKKIFVCSTFDLFHPATIENKTDIIGFRTWRDEIFREIEFCSWHTFIILTKLPERIDRPMPKNVIIGVSVTRADDIGRIVSLHKQTAEVKMVSFEPILEPDFVLVPNGLMCGLGWVIAGRLTGHGKQNDPPRKTIATLVRDARRFSVPVFLKSNLQEICGGRKLIQEFPK